MHASRETTLSDPVPRFMDFDGRLASASTVFPPGTTLTLCKPRFLKHERASILVMLVTSFTRRRAGRDAPETVEACGGTYVRVKDLDPEMRSAVTKDLIAKKRTIDKSS